MSSVQQNLHTYGHVSTGWASRYASDRFLNPNALVCPLPNYIDTVGRPAGHYSIKTTSAGCNSANERVYVEVDQRPSSYTSASLNNLGIEGGFSTCGQMSKDAIYGRLQTHLNAILLPDQRASSSQNLRNNQWVKLSEKIVHYKSLSGCND